MGSFYDQPRFFGSDIGIETMPRDIIPSSSAPTSQTLQLSYFTPTRSYTATQVRTCTAGTAAAATPTLCRIGFYRVESNGDLTLVCACANDTTLFAAQNTVYTRDMTTAGGLPSSFTFEQGQRYAGGILTVSATTMPNFVGFTTPSGTISAVEPRISATRTGQSDLPTSITSANLSTTAVRLWVGAV